ncbi:hepatitis A virus cellular receptor 1-like isoform X2 [Cheilinus undulatus]|uniref:hepatitis A virus cellular receptor 1-like isoform X2 n=1 Tax=Cheilinus undulatus TaxID=241271 RepID=UPI001BD57042|nr:hepatitis A virus cellular receptor 1-like isoform X2 [Cheilinus undulatus]
MLSLLLHSLTVCFFTVPITVAGVAMETVVGVAGRRVTLPCRIGSASQPGVEVCWGLGAPSLFTCHNTVINRAGDQTTYRKSSRYSSSSLSSSLSILNSRLSDSGFYHCRVQLPGLFNDQTSSVYLIIIKPHSTVSEPSAREDSGNLNTPLTTAGFYIADLTQQTGSDVTADSTTGPVVALVQSSDQQENAVSRLQNFIMNTLRASFIVFVPALMLTATYRFWRANQRAENGWKMNQSEEEEDSSV